MPYRDPAQARSANLEANRRFRARKRARDLVALDNKVSERPQISDIERAWAAGLFEGEGTISITTVRTPQGHEATRGIVSCTSTDKEIVNFFLERWGGCLHTVKPRKANHKLAWAWSLNSVLSILRFIADIKPFLRTSMRKKKFEIVERTQRLRQRGSKSHELKNILLAARQEMLVLNHRGVVSPIPGRSGGILPVS